MAQSQSARNRPGRCPNTCARCKGKCNKHINHKVKLHLCKDHGGVFVSEKEDENW